jgi:hypothetical protein
MRGQRLGFGGIGFLFFRFAFLRFALRTFAFLAACVQAVRVFFLCVLGVRWVLWIPVFSHSCFASLLVFLAHRILCVQLDKTMGDGGCEPSDSRGLRVGLSAKTELFGFFLMWHSGVCVIAEVESNVGRR